MNKIESPALIAGDGSLHKARVAVLHALNDRIADEIVEVACDVVNIASPTGEEEEVGKYLASRFGSLGMAVSMQEVETRRDNMIAHLDPNSSGPSIMFNGHMDTSTTGRERPDLPIGLLPKAVIEDGWLYGLGASNMKAAFSAYYGAIRMITAAGIRLNGRVTVSGVVGEIEKAPVSQYQGPAHRGGGCGANYAVQHGLMADVVIIGEPTGMRIQNAASSYMFCKVGTRGVAQHTWSRERGVDALDKGMFVLNELRKWEPEFERLVAGAKIGGRLTVGAIEGGFPYKPSIAPAPMCDIFVDVRFPADHSVLKIANLLRRRLAELAAENPGLDPTFEVFLCRNGFLVPPEDPFFQGILEAHELAGEPPTSEVDRNRYFVSADATTFMEYGMKAVAYGPGGMTKDGSYQMYDDRGEVCRIANLLACARSYAMLILSQCGVAD
ncbi:MAG TPA: M20/M25/M40 family metallo-hydrolase [Xanthobacteraceae bacterium]|jgi:acetylornithine deacetylase